MERMRSALKQWSSSPAYEPLDDGTDTAENQHRKHTQRFSWLEYGIFLLLGISMLWAWYALLSFSSASTFMKFATQTDRSTFL